MATVGRIAAVLIAGVVVLLVLAVLANTSAQHHAHTIFDEPAVIDQAQFDGAALGSDEAVLEKRFNNIGIPENTTSPHVRHAFGAHPDDIACAFWKVTGRPGILARLCFTSPDARLASKRERTVAG
jgi:hypothetical protein